jgi:hypothetical protein
MAEEDPPLKREVRHNLQYSAASEFGDYISIKEVKNKGLHGAWRTFQNNIESIRVMVLLPNSIVTESVDYLIPLAQAVVNATGKTALEDSEYTEDVHAAINEEFISLPEPFFFGKNRSRLMYSSELQQVTNFNLSSSLFTKRGIFALLESQIIGVWTAFNTLTTDLLVAAVNTRPNCLYSMGQQQIELKTLLDAGDDWSSNIGNLSRIFFRLDSYAGKGGTVEAYNRLFRDAKIDEALGRPITATACLVRNLCIHDNTVATADFISQAKKLKAEPWQSAREGELLTLNGKDVAELLEGVIHSANDLVRALDLWIGWPAESSAKSPDPMG